MGQAASWIWSWIYVHINAVRQLAPAGHPSSPNSLSVLIRIDDVALYQVDLKNRPYGGARGWAFSYEPGTLVSGGPEKPGVPTPRLLESSVLRAPAIGRPPLVPRKAPFNFVSRPY